VQLSGKTLAKPDRPDTSGTEKPDRTNGRGGSTNEGPASPTPAPWPHQTIRRGVEVGEGGRQWLNSPEAIRASA
jgi:hypothetical protein